MKKIILSNDTVYDWKYNLVVGLTIRVDYKVGDHIIIKFARYLPFEADRKRKPWRRTKCAAIIKKIVNEFIFVDIE